MSNLLDLIWYVDIWGATCLLAAEICWRDANSSHVHTVTSGESRPRMSISAYSQLTPSRSLMGLVSGSSDLYYSSGWVSCTHIFKLYSETTACQFRMRESQLQVVAKQVREMHKIFMNTLVIQMSPSIPTTWLVLYYFVRHSYITWILYLGS
jgi:hypothetical protein